MGLNNNSTTCFSIYISYLVTSSSAKKQLKFTIKQINSLNHLINQSNILNKYNINKLTHSHLQISQLHFSKTWELWGNHVGKIG